jgi:hypothetical protein
MKKGLLILGTICFFSCNEESKPAVTVDASAPVKEAAVVVIKDGAPVVIKDGAPVVIKKEASAPVVDLTVIKKEAAAAGVDATK